MTARGKRDRRITFQRRTVTRDTNTGRDTITWPDVATVWASKTELTGRELLLAQQMVATAEVRFNIRWRSDLLASDRISCEGKTYDIQHLAEIGRREDLDILAKLPDAS